jgi:hypothetical protein
MYRAQLEAHPDTIELPTEQIALGHVRVAELGGVVVGFVALLERIGDACELDALFVEPDRMQVQNASASLPPPRMSRSVAP